MTCIIIVTTAIGVVNNIATSSRQLWAFAGDRGVPFSGWFSAVSSKGIPANALIFSYIFSVLLSLINIEGLWEKMSEEDKKAFNFDVQSIDWVHYFSDVHIAGVVKYVLK